MPPRAGPFGRCGFFRAFSAHFCMILEHLLFKRQNVGEKSAENLQKMGAKICTPKICAKMGAKISTPKICAKNRLEHSVCLEDGSQKKKDKKNLCQNCAKPQPQRFQTPSSVSFCALTEFPGESSVSSSQPIICV